MAEAVVLPKLGNTVETCIIVAWRKQPGDDVVEGEPLCEVETDKVTQEVESPASGTLLGTFFQAGDEVPVMTVIAAIGEPGEDVEELRPASAAAVGVKPAAGGDGKDAASEDGRRLADPTAASPRHTTRKFVGMSPRARRLAEEKGIDTAGIAGSGPGGRIIERDVEAALEAPPRLTPVARRLVATGNYAAPKRGGRITSRDLIPIYDPSAEDDIEVVPVTSVRKVIAERMLQSMQTTAQHTLNAVADARQLLAFRKRLKESPEELGLHDVTINDLILYVVAQTLPQYPALNAHFVGREIWRYTNVHLGFAVDTPRGLLVPVIRRAQTLSLEHIALKAKYLAEACLEGTISPDHLVGATFTLSNLGSFGIESFTPILNPPQVAILGVGSITLRPVAVDDAVDFIPHIGLSLTLDHQAVDGAGGARFLQALSHNIASLELTLAL